MRRPPFGISIIRGLTLLWKKLRVNIDNGYVPSQWSTRDRRDAERAMTWLGDFIDWYEERKEQKDAEVADEPVRSGAEEPGPDLEERPEEEGPQAEERAEASDPFDATPIGRAC